MTEHRLGFAVVGCGKMGKRRIKTIIQHPNAELVCIVDNNEHEAKSLAEEANCSYYRDFKKAIECDDVDCVVVCLPNKFHAQASISALENGKHVFCEKPLAKDPEEALMVVEAAIKNGVFVKTGSNLKYFPNVQKAKALIDNGSIGRLLFLRGWIGNAGKHLKNSWYSNHELTGGGTFLDNGCHMLDLTRWFLGEVGECTGYIGTTFWPINPLEDNGFGIFKTLDGKLAFVQSSWTEWSEYMYMEIYGTEGFVRIDNRDQTSKTILKKKDGDENVFDYSLQPKQSYWLEFQDFFKAIQEGRQPLPSCYDGWRAVQMAYGIYESSRTGRAVKIYGVTEEKLSKRINAWCTRVKNV